jgi:quinol monooxygenase YgiN
MPMVITVVWDTWLKPGAEAEGLRLTRQVWSDMRAFEGYVSHELLIDQEAPGHVIALARWRSREDADRVRELYKDSETIRLLTPLLTRPRERWVRTSQIEGAKDVRLVRQLFSKGRVAPVGRDRHSYNRLAAARDQRSMTTGSKKVEVVERIGRRAELEKGL